MGPHVESVLDGFSKGKHLQSYRNGTESRDLLPLWNGVIFTSGKTRYIDAQSNQ